MFVKNRNVCQKSMFWSKIDIFVKNRNVCQKSKFWSKIEIFVKNQSFDQKSKFWNFNKKFNIRFIILNFISKMDILYWSISFNTFTLQSTYYYFIGYSNCNFSYQKSTIYYNQKIDKISIQDGI